MKVTTMTLTVRRQSVFPLEWCKRFGLEKGGPLNVFDVGDGTLIVRAPRLPSPEVVAALLAQTPAGKHSARAAERLVRRALKQVRRETRRR